MQQQTSANPLNVEVDVGGQAVIHDEEVVAIGRAVHQHQQDMETEDEVTKGGSKVGEGCPGEEWDRGGVRVPLVEYEAEAIGVVASLGSSVVVQPTLVHLPLAMGPVRIQHTG